jgi:hypothetical protein
LLPSPKGTVFGILLNISFFFSKYIVVLQKIVLTRFSSLYILIP